MSQTGCCTDKDFLTRQRSRLETAIEKEGNSFQKYRFERELQAVEREIDRRACGPDTCMMLPEGKRCKDCVYFLQCQTMFGQEDSDYCQFFPRRFRPIEVAR